MGPVLIDKCMGYTFNLAGYLTYRSRAMTNARRPRAATAATAEQAARRTLRVFTDHIEKVERGMEPETENLEVYEILV